MEFWSWGVIGILLCVIAVLLVKLYLLRKSAREIAEAFADRLMTDTNTLIDISTKDKYMCELADAINTQLRSLRAQRHRFVQGDAELKNAVVNISHDLRTPLTAICGYLELLEQEESSAEVQRYVHIIQNRTELLNQLTEELFRYSILLSAESREVDEAVVINDVLEESIAAFYSDFHARSMTLDIRLCDVKVVRNMDRSDLSRVFSNLINNAIKYSDGDLRITLSQMGEITFTNTVHGLDEIQVERLFDRFYTVETARKSTGLGLAIARTLVEQMHGSIAAEYKEDKLCIRICLPDAR